ncbi:MAG: VacB/RNase II family 3'-5' exoribonuclease [Gammaproteobacteria bacterium]|nr:VacB/RNase II family 3'-5' exoribonuclease [Gammaproteobacteria bacterium]
MEKETQTSHTVVGIAVKDHKKWYLKPLTPGYKDNIPFNGKVTLKQGEIVRAKIKIAKSGSLSVQIESRIKTHNEVDRAIKSFLLVHNVPHDDWDSKVTDYPETVNPSALKRRRDLRNLAFVTIDGETAKDFDDAIYVEKTNAVDWKLFVAIADVAHYVKVDSPLDVEAKRRGNSVYLPDFVITMLPEELSNGICSLNPSVDRLVVVCEMDIDANGNTTSYSFYDAVIHSAGRLTYTEVNRISTSQLPARSNAINNSLSEFYKLYRCLRQRREERGALDFTPHTSEVRVADGEPVRVGVLVQNDAHRMIEEAMIAANICAAKYLQEQGLNGMYRIHDKPDSESIGTLQAVLNQCNLQIDRKLTATPKDFQLVLNKLRESGAQSWIWEIQVLRALTQAQYAFDNRGHFGLALQDYAHFTSPIRRYSDLYVHRLVKSTFKSKLQQDQPVSAAQRELGIHLSECERRAEIVSRRVDSWLKCSLLKKYVGKAFWGYVVSVEEFGLFVEIDDFYIAGLIHISELGKEYFVYRGSNLCGWKTDKTYSLGDRLQVTVTGVDVESAQLDLVETCNYTTEYRTRKQYRDDF